MATNDKSLPSGVPAVERRDSSHGWLVAVGRNGIDAAFLAARHGYPGDGPVGARCAAGPMARNA